MAVQRRRRTAGRKKLRRLLLRRRGQKEDFANFVPDHRRREAPSGRRATRPARRLGRWLVVRPAGGHLPRWRRPFGALARNGRRHAGAAGPHPQHAAVLCAPVIINTNVFRVKRFNWTRTVGGVNWRSEILILIIHNSVYILWSSFTKLLSIMRAPMGESFGDLKRRVERNFRRNGVRYKCAVDIFFRVNQKKTFFFILSEVSDGVGGRGGYFGFCVSFVKNYTLFFSFHAHLCNTFNRRHFSRRKPLLDSNILHTSSHKYKRVIKSLWG